MVVWWPFQPKQSMGLAPMPAMIMRLTALKDSLALDGGLSQVPFDLARAEHVHCDLAARLGLLQLVVQRLGQGHHGVLRRVIPIHQQ